MAFTYCYHILKSASLFFPTIYFPIESFLAVWEGAAFLQGSHFSHLSSL